MVITAWEIVNMKISVEREWLCIRQPDQKLLWKKRLNELPPNGFSLESIVDDLRTAKEQIEKNKKRSQVSVANPFFTA
jgi:hypothetical protein